VLVFVVCMVAGMGWLLVLYRLSVVWICSGVAVDCVDAIDTSSSA